jgi:ribosomal protein S12 methylthiotransferase
MKNNGTNGKATIHVVTMGCSKNLVDSEFLLAQLKHGSVHLTKDIDAADTVVINTCGFIEAAKQESVDAILEAVERKKLGGLKKIVVMGCLSERYRRELREEIPEVELFLGSNNLREVVEGLGSDFRKDLLGERVLSTPRHYAFLKISEGCDHPCSFCAIPIMRGKHRSKRHEDIIAEAQLLAAGGTKELIVIAQDSTYYGVDLYGERRLDALLNDLGNIPGISWVRLMYTYPAQFPSSLLDLFQANPRMCRYLDMPVQHISDSVLKSMWRGISSRATRELIANIQNKVPGIALRTTLIVGYPGETENDFQMLCDFVEETKFHRLGVFTYSHEEGTRAYELQDSIPQAVKDERRDILMRIQQRISEERNESLAGKSVKVLVDRKEDGMFVGRTEWDAPEIDEEVFVDDCHGVRVGDFCEVEITGSSEYDLYAVARPDNSSKTE